MHNSKYKNNLKEIYYFWACDYSKISGEGILGNLFIKNFQNKNRKSKIYTVETLKIKNRKINTSLFEDNSIDSLLYKHYFLLISI